MSEGILGSYPHILCVRGRAQVVCFSGSLDVQTAGRARSLPARGYIYIWRSNRWSKRSYIGLVIVAICWCGRNKVVVVLVTGIRGTVCRRGRRLRMQSYGVEYVIKRPGLWLADLTVFVSRESDKTAVCDKSKSCAAKLSLEL